MKIVQIINTGDTAQNVIESGGGGGGEGCWHPTIVGSMGGGGDTLAPPCQASSAQLFKYGFVT